MHTIYYRVLFTYANILYQLALIHKLRDLHDGLGVDINRVTQPRLLFFFLFDTIRRFALFFPLSGSYLA